MDDVDGAWETMKPQLEISVFPAIDAAREAGHNILIHCTGGISRSAAVIYGYLMSRCGVTLDQAFNYVRSFRPHVELKPHMRKGLEAYSQEIHKYLR